MTPNSCTASKNSDSINGAFQIFVSLIEESNQGSALKASFTALLNTTHTQCADGKKKTKKNIFSKSPFVF